MSKVEEYDLDKDGVLDERGLQLAMEKEAKKSRRNRFNVIFPTHPPTLKRTLLLSIEGAQGGRFTSQNLYRHV